MVTNYFRTTLFVIVGLVCAVSYGEELPELIGRLQKTNGNGPVRGTVHIEDHVSGKKDESSKKLEKADLIIRADANTLTLSVSGDISDSRIFQEFSLLRAKELVDYGPALAGKLAGLKLVEMGAGSHEGKPCTRWRLKSEEKESKLGMSVTRRRDAELRIDAEGYPVAASFKMRGVSKILFMKLSSEISREQCYERLGGRLMLVFDKYEDAVKHGKSVDKRIVTTTVEVKKD